MTGMVETKKVAAIKVRKVMGIEVCCTFHGAFGEDVLSSLQSNRLTK